MTQNNTLALGNSLNENFQIIYDLNDFNLNSDSLTLLQNNSDFVTENLNYHRSTGSCVLSHRVVDGCSESVLFQSYNNSDSTLVDRQSYVNSINNPFTLLNYKVFTKVILMSLLKYLKNNEEEELRNISNILVSIVEYNSQINYLQCFNMIVYAAPLADFTTFPAVAKELLKIIHCETSLRIPRELELTTLSQSNSWLTNTILYTYQSISDSVLVIYNRNPAFYATAGAVTAYATAYSLGLPVNSIASTALTAVNNVVNPRTPENKVVEAITEYILTRSRYIVEWIRSISSDR